MVINIKNLKKSANFIFFRFRYLINYIIIGFFSVLLEVIIVGSLGIYNISLGNKIAIGFLAGVLLSFILNSKLNFRVPRSKNARTFGIFLAISLTALFLNLFLMLIFTGSLSSNYSASRFVTAAFIFILSYAAHRKITFNFIKKVGVAVYLNKDESISEVYSKIRYYSDFIHIDIVDESFNENASQIDLSLIKKIETTWLLEKHLHIMSKNPSKWIKKLSRKVDLILFHLEIDEPIDKVIALCRALGKKVGIAVTIKSDLKELEKIINKLDYVQVMGIGEVGKSGQKFNPESLSLLKKVNVLKRKHKFRTIFDGGVKTQNISRINSEYIVAASSLLHSDDPINSFMDLKTSSRYHQTDLELREDILSSIRKIINEDSSIISGNLVGTFAESGTLIGASDIDVVLIVDELNKSKFDQIINKFVDVKENIESKYGIKTIINSTLGPLKFNEEGIVFHVMIYDLALHKLHCIVSPFTCYDWQRSRKFIKKPLDKLYKVMFLQPRYFFNSRRSAKDYLSDIKQNRISYRKYLFKKGRTFEEKLTKEMNERDKIEFSYHITRFLLLNFLKMYHRKNFSSDFNYLVEEYFRIFPLNRSKHIKFLKRINKLKKLKEFPKLPDIIEKLESFIIDFEKQFENYFKKGSTEITFIRHAKPRIGKDMLFVGQRLDPTIERIKEEEAKSLRELFENSDILISSPLRRCLETLSSLTKKQIKIFDNIKEIDYGEADGKNLKFLSLNYPEIIESWKIGEDPKFPNGENTRDVLKRLGIFLNEIKKTKNKKIVVCTHNVVLRCLIGAYTRLPLNEWYKIELGYLEKIKCLLTRDGKIFIELSDEQIEKIFENLQHA